MYRTDIGGVGDLRPFVNEKYCRLLVHIRQFALPGLHTSCHDIFIVAGNVHGDAKAGLRFAVQQDLFGHFLVPIGCFDKKLSLVFIVSP